MRYKIFQICFDPKQIPEVDPLLTPFDNTSNERPELREFHSFEKILSGGHADNLDAWGVFGPRWHEKMRFDALELHTAIRNNPGNDVYIFNHARVVNSLTYNVWEHGEFWHKGIKRVTKTALESCGYNSSVLDEIMTDTTCYCSYFVASKEFWNSYMEFLREIKTALENLTGEDADIYHGSANYARDANLNLFPFIVERLFSTFLHIKQYRVYSHNPNFELYRPQIEDFSNVLASLHNIKQSSVGNESMIQNWNSIRLFFLTTQQQLLSLD